MIAPETKSPAIALPGKPELVIFTACSTNYLTKALAMCRSALQHVPEADVVIMLADRKRAITIGDTRIRLLWAEDLDYPDLLSCAFKYNIIEFNTALKPFAAARLLDQYRKVIYLDPDVCVYSGLESVIHGLDDAAALFTPHALSPYEGSGRPSDRDLLRFGAFNLGFFAVSDKPQARALLEWWHRQCLECCFYEPSLGLGVDQKWIDLALAFFEGAVILRDPGLNVAFWNLHERRLSQSIGRWKVNDAFDLGFVHFSSFVEADQMAIADKQTRYATGTRPDFAAASKVYREHLREAKDLVTVETAYGFETFDNGQSINPMLRRMYAIHLAERFSEVRDPFDSNGSVHAFARRNALLSVATATTNHQNFKVASAHAKEQRIISTLFRWALRLLGPERYFALMRYLAHYSSTLNQSDLLRK